MTLRPDERYRQVTFVDVQQFIQYMQEEQYADTEVTFRTSEIDGELAVLYITAIARCGLHQHHCTSVGGRLGLKNEHLPVLPRLIYETLYDISEELEHAQRAWGDCGMRNRN